MLLYYKICHAENQQIIQYSCCISVKKNGMAGACACNGMCSGYLACLPGEDNMHKQWQNMWSPDHRPRYPSPHGHSCIGIPVPDKNKAMNV